MTDSLEETIRKKIDRFQNLNERKRELHDTGEVPEENIPRTKRTIGNNSRAIALYHFKLEECNKEKSEFRTAVNYYLTSIEMSRARAELVDRNDPISIRYLLHAALLSGEEPLVKTAADLALETPSEYTEEYSSLYHYYYVMALASVIADTGPTQEYLDHLDEEIDAINPAYVEDDLHVLYRAWWTTLQGIVTQDDQRLRAGITDLLAHHDETTAEDSTKAKDLVCISAVALLVLAHRHGLEVHVDSEYIPDCVDELT